MLNESNIPLEEDGIEEEILVDEEVAITKAMWGDVGGNIENQTDLQNALDAKQDSLTEVQLNAVNSGITSEKVTTYDGYADQIASKADQSALNAESTARGEADTALGTRIDNEALARQSADNGLQSQIDAITSKSDVVDVVANYAALQAYDTSALGNNDVVKVLDDETHEDALTYYRWSTTTQTWTYIGQEAPYYSKGQMDVKLAEKQDKLTAGANIQIAQDGKTISATDTTYTAGNGLNLNGTEFSADTTVLATKSDLDDYYTKTETDTKLAPKLETEVVAELPTTGAEGKLYLTPKAHTTTTATGNPIEATITDEAGQIESFQLDGDTAQQTYSGKNLYKWGNVTFSSDVTNSSWCFQDGSTGAYGANITSKTTYKLTLPSGTYYLSAYDVSSNIDRINLCTDGGSAERVIVSPNGSFNLSEETVVVIRYRVTNPSLGIGNTKLQLESGSTATSYEPYVGAQPSPNPDYPQTIQTVTGEQTVSINGTDYHISLGSIELCKLGTYQDYIYKDGDDWKVHKKITKYVCDSTPNWTWDASVPRLSASSATLGLHVRGPSNADTAVIGKSNKFVANSFNYVYTQKNNGFAYSQSGFISCVDKEWGSESEAKADILGSIFYFVLRDAYTTDITITDANLIAQLEAIRTASLENGTNTITNTATGTNLAGDMEIGYFEFNPTNRYDKWLWLDLNNNYEQIGS